MKENRLLVGGTTLGSRCSLGWQKARDRANYVNLAAHCNLRVCRLRRPNRPFLLGLSRGRNGRGRNAESAINRKEHQFDAIVNAELVINVREMVLHGVLADAKRRCNISVGLAIDESPDNLHFPAC